MFMLNKISKSESESERKVEIMKKGICFTYLFMCIH